MKKAYLFLCMTASLGLMSLGLAACGDDDRVPTHTEATPPAAPALPKTNVVVITDWSQGDEGQREVRINGRECIETLYFNYYGTGNGIWCNSGIRHESENPKQPG